MFNVWKIRNLVQFETDQFNFELLDLYAIRLNNNLVQVVDKQKNWISNDKQKNWISNQQLFYNWLSFCGSSDFKIYLCLILNRDMHSIQKQHSSQKIENIKQNLRINKIIHVTSVIKPESFLEPIQDGSFLLLMPIQNQHHSLSTCVS